MNRLLKIASSGTPGAGLQFCEEAYGKNGIRRFLRDVLAMANAAVDGNRYIVTGIRFDRENERQVSSVDLDDFSGEPSYQALVAEFIEPPIRIKYRPVTIDGQCVGAYEISDCQDRPYMMRIDYSERLRRGDAYVRINDAAIKVGRRMLLLMLDKRTRCFVQEDAIEIGFPGEIIQKKLRVPTVDLRRLPSAIEHAKLSQLNEVREKTKNSGATTTMARLMHTRLFGSDAPYEDRSPTGLMAEMEQIGQKYETDDRLFLFEENAERLQLVIYNQGDAPIQNASLTLLMPNHEALYVATSLPAPKSNGQLDDGSRVEFADYPAVSARGNRFHASGTVGDIPTGAPIEVFELPLRFCAGSELDGKQLTLRYKLFGSNLRQPVQGKLVIAFCGTTRH